MVGFSQTLAKEGEKKNVHANVIAPLAGTRMVNSSPPFPPSTNPLPVHLRSIFFLDFFLG